MRLIDACMKRRRRKNALMMLVTRGGDADAAYRIGRCLQSKYERFFLYVSGLCKSAGTIIATGAHELIMSDHGELGPIDVQLGKKDELWEQQSGLTVVDTLMSLQERAFATFENFLLKLKSRSGDSVTLRTATQVAGNLTTGLLAPIYRQVDPMHIGESAREMAIASYYGVRLLEAGKNISRDSLEFITSEYPSHGFVIDRQEASQLFHLVREPSEKEEHLAEVMGAAARLPTDFTQNSEPLFQFLSEELPMVEDTQDDKQTGENHDDPAITGVPTRSEHSETAGKAGEQPAPSVDAQLSTSDVVVPIEAGDIGSAAT